jgi:hypothetical protein
MTKGILMSVLKLGTTGYIVGYDGQTPGGEVPRGKWVFPRDGAGATPIVHATREEALAELGDDTTVVGIGITGVKRYVLAVHYVKVRWLPLFEGHRGYAKIAEPAERSAAA